MIGKVTTRLKKDDLVVVMTGKDKGKTGKILKIDRTRHRAYVQGIQLIKKAMRPSAQNEKGGIITKEGSIHLSNLMIYSDKLRGGARLGSKRENGKKMRVVKKSGKEMVL